jgi:hypothetical protein
MKKLPEPFRTNWITALRSGKYRQASGWLYRKDKAGELSYCCLGVAACVLGVPIQCMEYANLTSVPHPNITKDILDVLNPDEGLFSIPQNILMRMNDVDDCTFDDIADYIEQKL